ncbi:hypothetical protein OIU74_008370 [Salix koriyanagi]|uniref:Uncharacterized protein n=1 Tax=Salix koriyanagi TaxID=2511006 RepID=A0A9Q0U612_9ROSI|nr:hypothetical protein OIU74_008370 [Salix koriyanagi]KAJ6723994.1 hypothetical protein OIU74_008370 [Salix koriyanagi]
MYFTRLSPFACSSPRFLPSIYLFTGRDNNHIALQTRKMGTIRNQHFCTTSIQSPKVHSAIDIVFATYRYGFPHQVPTSLLETLLTISYS